MQEETYKLRCSFTVDLHEPCCEYAVISRIRGINLSHLGNLLRNCPEVHIELRFRSANFLTVEPLSKLELPAIPRL